MYSSTNMPAPPPAPGGRRATLLTSFAASRRQDVLAAMPDARLEHGRKADPVRNGQHLGSVAPGGYLPTKRRRHPGVAQRSRWRSLSRRRSASAGVWNSSEKPPRRQARGG